MKIPRHSNYQLPSFILIIVAVLTADESLKRECISKENLNTKEQSSLLQYMAANMDIFRFLLQCHCANAVALYTLLLNLMLVRNKFCTFRASIVSFIFTAIFVFHPCGIFLIRSAHGYEISISLLAILLGFNFYILMLSSESIMKSILYSVCSISLFAAAINFSTFCKYMLPCLLFFLHAQRKPLSRNIKDFLAIMICIIFGLYFLLALWQDRHTLLSDYIFPLECSDILIKSHPLYQRHGLVLCGMHRVVRVTSAVLTAGYFDS